ncbi:MAG: hypothetical protein CL917_10590 [Deltaproteobacteria bacterium]|nr:hypothetical protein [Deltaproteobacteria bacterium]
MKSLRSYWQIPAVLLVGFGLVVFDEESGLPAWTSLKLELSGSRARQDALRDRVDGLRSEINSLERDPSAREQAIREELKLARPGEIVVRFSTQVNPR